MNPIRGNAQQQSIVTIEGNLNQVGKAVISGVTSVAEHAVSGVTDVAETAISAVTHSANSAVGVGSKLLGKIIDIWV